MNEKTKATRNRKKSPLYECIRCNYTTPQKSNMRRHLYTLTDSCPALKNNIELTPEIKENILANRRYIIPKEIKVKEEVSKIEFDEYMNFIYLVRPKENVNHNENVYKIGKGKTKELTGNVSRVSSYGKGTELILVIQCIDCDEMELLILDEFNKIFTRHKYGKEYFIGDKDEMKDIITDIEKKYRKEHKNKKAEELENTSELIYDYENFIM